MDPPWPIRRTEREVNPYEVGFDYPVMALDEIAGLSVGDMLADDAFVFLWTTQRFLPDAFPILAGWGVKYRFTMVWHNPGGFQVFNMPQFNGEFIVVGVKGNPQFLEAKAFNAVFNAPRAGHSVKPDEFYDPAAAGVAGAAAGYVQPAGNRGVYGVGAMSNYPATYTEQNKEPPIMPPRPRRRIADTDPPVAYTYPGAEKANAPTAETAQRLTPAAMAEQPIPPPTPPAAPAEEIRFPQLSWQRGETGDYAETYGPLYVHDKVSPVDFIDTLLRLPRCRRRRRPRATGLRRP